MKRKETNFAGRKTWKFKAAVRDASGQQGENERQGKIIANMNTGNKILGKHIPQFLHKNNV